jgi:hypothetical protein
MSIRSMQVDGLLTLKESRKDQKTGLEYSKIAIVGENGKKMEFKVMGRFSGLPLCNFGSRVVLDCDSPRLVMANYGDLLFECNTLEEAPKAAPSAPTPPPKG